MLHPLVRYGRADEVQRRLTEAIELGLYADGEQLPGEIELAGALGIAPVTLREALAGLRQAGLLETRRGRGGGTFVSLRQTVDERLRDHLTRWSANELRDLGELHEAVAEATARLAVQRAESSDVARLEQHIHALRGASSSSARTVADSRFHIELASTSRSIRLTRSEMELQAQLAGLVWALGVDRDLDDRVAAAVRAHADVVDAVRRRRPEAAAKATRAHIREENEMLVSARLRLYGGRTHGRAHRLDGVARVTRQFVRGVFAVVAEVRDEVLRAWDRSGQTSIDGQSLQPLAQLAAERVGGGPESVDGLGVAFVAEVASPRWAWWSATDRGAAPLAVDLDPRHPDYYDYAMAEWFTMPLRRQTFCVAGPFVDISCSADQVCTFAAPIIGRDGTNLGVAGADVTVQRLEETVVPALRKLSHRAALLNSTGVIIASNSGDMAPGSNSARPPSRPASATVDAVPVDPSTRWWVCRR